MHLEGKHPAKALAVGREVDGDSRLASRRKAWGTAVFLGGIAIAAVAIASIGTGSSGGASGIARSTGSGGSDFIPAHIPGGAPCANGEKVAGVSALASSVADQVWTPNTPVASPKNLTGTWLCGTTPLLTFASGVTVTFEAGWASVGDPLARWTAQVDQWGRGEVREVLGRPAFVQPVGEVDALGKPVKGQVLVIVGDTLVDVLGDGHVPTQQLIATAKSLSIPDSLRSAPGTKALKP